MKKTWLKFVLVIPALAGLFLLASIPNFSTKANDKDFPFRTEGEIRIEKDVHDFGTIKEHGGNVSATFTIKNNSKTPIVITNATSSCGCTVPNWTKEPINPGKTGDVIATFNPIGRIGTINKSITITTTGGQDKLMARIIGMVEN